MPERERTPLHDIDGAAGAQFSTTAWDDDGLATVEATGADVRSALEAGLRGVLALSYGSDADYPASDRSDPLQGEGDDLANLMLDLIEDLLDQMALSPHAYRDVAIDGVLQREGGGYTAWGYAAESTAPSPQGQAPVIQRLPDVESGEEGIVFRATLTRKEE